MERVRRPNGQRYSPAFLSRIEAGYANSPLYAYIHLAEGYDLDVARVLGHEEPEKPVGEAEMTLIRFLRRLGITPDEAMAGLARRLSGPRGRGPSERIARMRQLTGCSDHARALR
ncbi:MAG: hypothetical protein ACRDL6_01745 [Solirubrobacterales bacterium]